MLLEAAALVELLVVSVAVPDAPGAEKLAVGVLDSSAVG